MKNACAPHLVDDHDARPDLFRLDALGEAALFLLMLTFLLLPAAGFTLAAATFEIALEVLRLARHFFFLIIDPRAKK